MRSSIESIAVRGVRLRVEVAENNLRSYAIERILTQVSANPKPTAASQGDSKLPLDTIEWENCRILLHDASSNGGVELVTRGSMQAQNDGRLTARMTIRDVAGGAIDGAMSLYPGGALRFRALSNALSATTVSTLASAYLGIPFTDIAGTIAFDFSGTFGDGLPHVQGSISPSFSAKIASADPTNLATTNLSASRGVFHFDMVLARENPVWNLSVEDLDFGFSDASFEGVTGGIEIDRWPIGSTWLSDLRARRVSFGKMEMTGALATFAIDNPRRVALRNMRVGWLDGTVEVSSVFLDPLAPKLSTTVQVRNIDAHKLVELLAEPYATTTGKVSGSMQVALDWPELRLGTGKLEVAGGGRLQFKDKQMLARLLGQGSSDPQAPESQQRQAAIDALNDFDFEQMSAEMVEGPDGHVTRLVLQGRGRSGTRQALNLQLNITGVNDALYYGLILGRQLPF